VAAPVPGSVPGSLPGRLARPSIRDRATPPGGEPADRTGDVPDPGGPAGPPGAGGRPGRRVPGRHPPRSPARAAPPPAALIRTLIPGTDPDRARRTGQPDASR
jgi:hypothetical protein